MRRPRGGRAEPRRARPSSGGRPRHAHLGRLLLPGGSRSFKRCGRRCYRPPVLLMAESFGKAVQSRARQMGVASVVFKPGLSKLEPEQFQADLKAFSQKLLSDVLRVSPAEARVAPTSAKLLPESPTAIPSAPRPHELERELLALQERFENSASPGVRLRLAAP